MAKSGQNEIIDCRNGCCKRTNRLMYCIILNTTDDLSLKLNHNCVLKIYTFFNDTGDLIRSTERKTQSTQAEFISKATKNIEMLHELREKFSTCNSSSQIEGEVINADTRAPDKIKKETVNAITLATHLVAALNQIHRENLPRVMRDFTHLLRAYAENVTLDNSVVSECGCALKSIGTGTQSNTVNGEFSSETSLDTPTKACGKNLHADFIPEEIAKVSDTLTAETRLTCDVVVEETVLYTRKSVILMACGTEEKTLWGGDGLLIPPVIDADKQLNIAAATDVATEAMQREFFPIHSTEIPQDFSAFSDEICPVSRLDESLDAKVPALLSTVEIRMDGDVMSVRHLETAMITAAVTSEKEGEEAKEEGELSSDVSLRLPTDKDISVVKTALRVIVGLIVTNSVEESTIREPTYLTKDMLEVSTSIKYEMRLSEKIQAIKETKHSPAGEATPPTQDMFSESVQIKHKMPRHRKTWTAKETDKTSPVGKPTQPAKNMFQESVQSTYGMPRFKKTRTIKDTVVESLPTGEELTQLTKDTYQDSAQTRYKVSRFKKTRAIKDTEDGSSPAGESTPSANDVLRKSVQTVQKTARSKKSPTTKGIGSCSINAFTSFTCPRTIKRSCAHFERSTTAIGRDYRQPKSFQPKCCRRFGHCDTARILSLQNETTRNAAPERQLCYPFLQDPCASRCHRGGYWWWGKTCDINSQHGKYAAVVGNSLHTHTCCNGDTTYHWPHLSSIDNCQAGHCHWNDERHCGRS